MFHRDANVENVAPAGAAQVRRSLGKKPLGLRQHPANASNLPAKSTFPAKPSASKPGTVPPAIRKRRALGDITNRRAGPASATQPSAEQGNPSKLRAHVVRKPELRREVPHDEHGNIEDPEIFPAPLPRGYEPPVLDFTAEELAAMEEPPKDDPVDMFGRPFVPTKWEFPPAPLNVPLPRVHSVDSFEGRLEDFASVRKEDARFTPAEMMLEDEFSALELA